MCLIKEIYCIFMYDPFIIWRNRQIWKLRLEIYRITMHIHALKSQGVNFCQKFFGTFSLITVLLCYSFGKRINAQKLLVKCWWNWFRLIQFESNGQMIRIQQLKMFFFSLLFVSSDVVSLWQLLIFHPFFWISYFCKK